ncbi:MAG TPA: MMPL family transporter, partial [Solirubrobacterales bacterium]
RTERAGGSEIPDAIATAVATSGTAIVFAGGTVVIALVSLMVAGIPLVTSLGYASAFAVLTAILASISLLPAVLAAVGRHIDSVRLPAFLHPKPKPANRGFWGAWARGVTEHPWRAVGASVLIFGIPVIPFFSLELGQEDTGATPKDTQERQAYDLLASGFGPGYTSPLQVAVELSSPAKPSSTFEKQYARAQSLQDQLEDEQATGQLQAASLQRQADELEAQQAQLLAEKASLETKAGNLKAEKAKLSSSAKKLKREKKLLTGANALLAEAKQLASQAAALAKEAAQVAAALRERPSRELVQALKQIQAEMRELKAEATALKDQFAKLGKEASKVGGEAFGLATSAAAAGREAIALVQEKNQLVQEGSQLKVEAAQLQTGKAQLDALQEQAETQQQQAEKLKTTLTDELTAAGGDQRGTDPRLVSLQDAMKGTTGVQLVSPPQINKPGNAAVFTVISTTDPADDQTADLVKTLRAYVIPESTAGTDTEAHVGGQTASYVDLATAITDKLFLVIVTVITLGFLVLLMAFRSWIVSTQAAVCNLLSVCAAFGVVTACFQFGWGIDLVGIDTASDEVPIASFVPLIMFAVLFGLSMDYQVFLMSQVEHARANTRGNRRAIATGLASGARVISAAALIMISVFASFILDGDPTVKQFGVGLSVGVALAGISVLLLAPALLVLAGRGAWWVPRWADRVVPHMDIEGAGVADQRDGKSGAVPERPRKGSMKL